MRLCTAFLILTFTANAQDAIPPSKRALIDELIKVTDLAATTRKTMDMMANQVGANFNENFSKMIPDMDKLPADKREKAVTLGKEMGQRIVKRMFEEMNKIMDFKEMSETVYIPLYNKFYTEGDLRGLIAFYKTPTGVKFVKVMPELMAETTRLTQQSMTPKLMKVVMEIMQDEQKKMQEEMQKLQD